jgi:hypothetical protein
VWDTTDLSHGICHRTRQHVLTLFAGFPRRAVDVYSAAAAAAATAAAAAVDRIGPPTILPSSRMRRVTEGRTDPTSVARVVVRHWRSGGPHGPLQWARKMATTSVVVRQLRRDRRRDSWNCMLPLTTATALDEKSSQQAADSCEITLSTSCASSIG